MATLAELVGLLAFLGAVGITIVKLYNISTLGELWARSNDTYRPIRLAFFTFIGFWLFFGLSFSVFMLNASNLLYFVLFRFVQLCAALTTLAFLAELLLFFHQQVKSIDTEVKPYNAKEQYEKMYG